MARDELKVTRRPIVIDDFHFVPREVQRAIVRSLKPIVLEGLPVVFASVSHRVRDVVTAEPDLTGRVHSLPVTFWDIDELVVIAQKGFEKLNLFDRDDSVALVLAQESYGSPHLMQQFCREICKVNGLRETAPDPRPIEPPPDWGEFFAAQVDDASADWFQTLLRGPQERGSPRTQWRLKDGRELDGYGLTLAAIASTGPRLSLSKDALKAAVERLVDSSGPAANQTTRVLQHMTRIAAKRADESLPTEEEHDNEDDQLGVADAQPVLEYMERGPGSELHIADPFFAFYLKWGTARHLSGKAQEGGRTTPSASSVHDKLTDATWLPGSEPGAAS